MKTFLGEICTPAGVYLSVSIFFIIYEILYWLTKQTVKTTELLFNEAIIFAFVVIWTYILQFLCSRVSVTLVWFLVIFNIFLTLYSVIFITTKNIPYNEISITRGSVTDASNNAPR